MEEGGDLGEVLKVNKKTLPGIGILDNEDAESAVQTEVTLRSNSRRRRTIQRTSTLNDREVPPDTLEEPQLYGTRETTKCPEIDRECGDYRHWSPTSQPYAPAHVLLQYLRYGWKADSTIFIKSFRCLSSRSIAYIVFC
jgi:hypothetical protein